ncbi:MAG: Crp/Fnr family transcriptional regulator [Syntrophales bacterium]|nr:Crp/Fnr family transcriptional regulator [Syntrophales bacterium]
MEKIHIIRKTRDILAKSQLFGGLPLEHIAELEKIAIRKQYKKGEIIFHDDDEGTGFYLIAEGRVSVYKLSADGKEKILHILEEGDTLGVVPVFSGRSFPANASAITKSCLLFFNRTDFVRLISNKPSLVMNMLALFAARLREFTLQVENLALKEIPGRLASYLLYLAQEQGNGNLVQLNISKTQLANLLGTGPESLSRVLGNLKKRKLIAEKGNIIQLLDLDALRELAEGGKIYR